VHFPSNICKIFIWHRCSPQSDRYFFVVQLPSSIPSARREGDDPTPVGSSDAGKLPLHSSCNFDVILLLLGVNRVSMGAQ